MAGFFIPNIAIRFAAVSARDNRHYIAHQCDLPRGVATMFESFIDVAHRDHHLFITTHT
jgi:hypothetical protein